MGLKINVKALLKKHRDAKQIAIGDVEKVRAAIADLRAERQAIEAAPVTFEEAERRVDSFLDNAEAKAAFNVTAFASAQADWQRWADDAIVNPEARSFHALAERLLGVMVATNREGIKKMFLDQLTDHFEDKTPLAEADRAEQMAAIDAELLRLEKAEEQLIRAAEEMGSPILRREDAAPVVVLSSDAELAA